MKKSINCLIPVDVIIVGMAIANANGTGLLDPTSHFLAAELDLTLQRGLCPGAEMMMGRMMIMIPLTAAALGQMYWGKV
jgi:hypothetical protein